MKQLTLSACAKLNLTLDVRNRRPDGYHDLCMVMQTVGLADTVTVMQSEEDCFSVSSNLHYLPGTEKNIAAVAARAFAAHTGVSLNGLRIDIRKRIPVCAGTAGGSSDGAAVLRGLNQWFNAGLSDEELMKIGEEVGSDVPFCLMGGTALAEGRGEHLTALPSLPDCAIVLCKPSFSVSTPELYRTVDRVKLRYRPDTDGMCHALKEGDLTGVCLRMFNVFEQVLPTSRRRETEEIKSVLLSAGALGACMTGTGPTVYGVFTSETAAQAAYEELKCERPETFLTRPVSASKNDDSPSYASRSSGGERMFR